MKQKWQNIHQDLLDKCLLGDQKAQFEIYKLYYKGMYNVSLRIVGNPEEAEDVMQEAFLKAFDKLGSYRGEVSFAAWLKKIVVNQSLDQLRKRKEQLVIMEENQIPDMVDEGSTQDMKWEVAHIKGAVDKLAPRYKTILSLFLFEGYDHQEISSLLKISYAAARTTYHRARQKLLETIRQEKETNYGT